MRTKKQLTILANAFVSTKSIGGGDRFIMQMVPQLTKTANVTIIFPKVGLYHWKHHGLAKAKYKTLSTTPFDNRDHPVAVTLAYLHRTLQSIKLISKTKPSHTITASQYFPDILPAAWMKFRYPKLCWITRIYHLVPPPSNREGGRFVNTVVYLLQRLMFYLIKQSNLIIADNPFTLKRLNSYGFSSSKLKLLVSGVEFTKISQHKPQKTYPFDAAYIGRLDPHKGIFDLPEIWKEVTEHIPSVKLAVAGYGPKSTTSSLKAKIHHYKLQNNIKLIGFLPHQQNGKHPFFDLLKSIKILLLPNHEGGWPLTVAEAMAARVPVIAYKLPIFTSVYENGVLTAKMKNKKEFASHCINLLTHTNQRKKLGIEAQKQAKQFDIKKISSQFTELIFPKE